MTMPGPDIFYACPKCQNLLYTQSYLSYSNFFAIYYSDGKISGSPSNYIPKITKCPKCERFFWLHDGLETKQTSYDTKYYKDKKQQPKKATFLSISEYLSVINNNNFQSKKDEIYIRKKIWWDFNDRIRENPRIYLKKIEHIRHERIVKLYKFYIRPPENIDIKKWFSRFKEIRPYFYDNTFTNPYRKLISEIDPNQLAWLDEFEFNEDRFKIPTIFKKKREKKIWQNNLEQLAELLVNNKTNDKITIAEINRNLGKFDMCLQLLDEIKEEKYNTIKRELLTECKKENKYVFALN